MIHLEREESVTARKLQREREKKGRGRDTKLDEGYRGRKIERGERATEETGRENIL